MHIYKRQARNLAWYDQDGEPTRNPFKKFKTQPHRSNSIMLESRLSQSYNADEARELERLQSTAAASHVVHQGQTDMLPAASSNVDQNPRPETDEGKLEPQSSAYSWEPINASCSNDKGTNLSKPRRRRTLPEKSSLGSDVNRASQPAERISDKPKFTVASQLKATLFNSWINILILCAPTGIVLYYVNVSPVAVFVVNFIAIIPLAAMLSYATEEIALRTGETIGGLLNATFGNAVELIVAIIALVADEVVIVQTSLIGSMLSNLLLVMGMCFFFGGINRLEQYFNPVVAQTAASLLSLAVGSLIIPTAFHAWSNAGESGIAPLSRGTSVLLLIVYGCYLFFQLKSHTDIYNAPSPKVEKRGNKVTEGATSRGIAQIGKMSAAMAGQHVQQMELRDPREEPDEPQLSIPAALLTLAISTTLVALCAEYMVDSINALTETGGISKTFVGLILLPIVGNAAEHATAVTVACKDKMDLAIGVAVGSSMQIALLVLPLVIVIGWIMGNDDMTLYFDPFQVILLFVAVLLVNYLISDGKSHWLEGTLLMVMYLIISVAAWFYPTHLRNESGSTSSSS